MCPSVRPSVRLSTVTTGALWSAGRGVVYKVAQWRSGSGRIHFVTVAVLRPFRYLVRPIWQMLLHTNPVDQVTLVIIIII